jgi:hypothetical protein
VRALTRPEQRRNAVIIEGATAQEKARALWENYLPRGCSHEDSDGYGGDDSDDHWLMSANLAAADLERWIIDGEPEVAEQVLDALVDQWQQTPVDMLLFSAGMAGDELATRLAWRLQEAAYVRCCQ